MDNYFIRNWVSSIYGYYLDFKFRLRGKQMNNFDIDMNGESIAEIFKLTDEEIEIVGNIVEELYKESLTYPERIKELSKKITDNKLFLVSIALISFKEGEYHERHDMLPMLKVMRERMDELKKKFTPETPTFSIH